MIPQHCYSDLIEVIKDIRFYEEKGLEASHILNIISVDLDQILDKWEESDDRELEGMCRVSEGKA